MQINYIQLLTLTCPGETLANAHTLSNAFAVF